MSSPADATEALAQAVSLTGKDTIVAAYRAELDKVKAALAEAEGRIQVARIYLEESPPLVVAALQRLSSPADASKAPAQEPRWTTVVLPSSPVMTIADDVWPDVRKLRAAVHEAIATDPRPGPHAGSPSAEKFWPAMDRLAAAAQVVDESIRSLEIGSPQPAPAEPAKEEPKCAQCGGGGVVWHRDLPAIPKFAKPCPTCKPNAGAK